MRAIVLGLALAALSAVPATAQQITFPALPWRRVETKHFVLYYPAAAAAWTLDVAAHIDAVYDEVSALAGNAPDKRISVVVDDPNNLSNGFALPFLSGPLIFFWPTPPSPASGIGDNRGWGEMLSVHEFAHIAHLARPSRNPWLRFFAVASQTDLGPLALKAPRWLTEGYATYVEGVVTGTGRPHSAWRAAVLRQWALDGQLPVYGQLDGDERFLGGSMAYLAGSAYLQWLVDRSGDSSLVHLWRRMSARTDRSFDEAFAGVFGGYPAVLYGRFAAQVTADAERLVQQSYAGIPGATRDSGQGTLVQALQWNTGAPAISPNGTLIAMVRTVRDRPSRVVVFTTALDTAAESAAARARARMLRLDPEDVAAIDWLPPPHHRVATLYPHGGVPYEQPRFMPDGHRLLLVRSTGRGDGALRNDLFIWDFRSNAMRRVTHAGGLRHADPAPDGEHAVADRCVAGICDVVLVDLRTGRLHTIARGSPRLVYFRPMFARDGQHIVVNVQSHGQWRPALLLPDTSVQRPRFIGPDDSANRYDAIFSATGSSVFVVSDASGVPNLERVDTATRTAVPLTHVTGAALAPAPDWVHGSIYFLRLHARGLDLAMTSDTAIHVAPSEAAASLEPAARLPLAAGDSFAVQPVAPDTPYGLGPRRYRVLPTVDIAAEGKTFGLTLASTDPIGRFTWLAQAAYGDRGAWRGGSLSGAWRGSVPSLGAQFFYAEDHVSTQHGGIANSGVPDVDYLGALASATVDRDLLTNAHSIRVGASAGRLDNRPDSRSVRWFGFARYSGGFVQTSNEWRFVEHLGVRGDGGGTAGRSWARARGSAQLTVSHGTLAVEGDGAIGVVNSEADPFELFALGGAASPLLDADLLPQRITMPALPVGLATGRRFATYRVSLPSLALTPYYWAASAGETLGNWHRIVGLEWTFDMDGFAPARLPAVHARIGAGYSLDEPFRKKARVYVGLRYGT